MTGRGVEEVNKHLAKNFFSSTQRHVCGFVHRGKKENHPLSHNHTLARSHLLLVTSNEIAPPGIPCRSGSTCRRTARQKKLVQLHKQSFGVSILGTRTAPLQSGRILDLRGSYAHICTQIYTMTNKVNDVRHPAACSKPTNMLFFLFLQYCGNVKIPPPKKKKQQKTFSNLTLVLNALNNSCQNKNSFAGQENIFLRCSERSQMWILQELNNSLCSVH